MVSDEDLRRTAARLYYKSVLSYIRLGLGLLAGGLSSIACRLYGVSVSLAVLVAVLAAGYLATLRLYHSYLPQRTRLLSGVIAMAAGVVAGIVIASQIPLAR